MIDRIVTFAVERRWLVLLLTTIAALIGAVSLSRLPIDAVPDVTNNQVQINVRAPNLSPELIEKQVTFPIETALAGIKGLESTRSLSLNGFAQVTAVFPDSTDIYFDRQQVAELNLTRAVNRAPVAGSTKGALARPAPGVLSHRRRQRHPTRRTPPAGRGRAHSATIWRNRNWPISPARSRSSRQRPRALGAPRSKRLPGRAPR